MSKLALFGGTPVRTKPFPSWPRSSKELKDQLQNTIDNELWGVGSKTIKNFEEAFATYQNAKYCITTNSGTTALWVSLKAAGVTAGDEVIIPSYTFIATASAILMANAVPVFVDAELESFNIDPDLIEAAITDRTKVIMPVHIGGNPAQMDKILAVAKKFNLIVIEDAAQAHGAEWNGTKVGALGMGGIFSFQTSKNMTAGEGGAIISNNEEFNNACFSYHNCGRVKGGQWYEHQHLGGNFRLNAFAAAILQAQLDTLDSDMDLRDRNRTLIDNALNQIPGLTPVYRYPQATRVANHLYLARYDQEQFDGIPREKFFEAMRAEGVFTYAGYVPLYKEKLFITNPDEYPWLKGRNYREHFMPKTEKLCTEQSVWLKQNHLLGTEVDTQDVIDAFSKVTAAMQQNPGLFK
ncbi:MAG: DegT/DnrJ/EryC1/StrS family aminotransferase [Candidatus Marinimicrobia bacterium]|nr:DegT/DnrJ/EryC1/StrS family aminotransferase [Candidatus Neomarinimicrobiota bacterium]